MADKPSLLPPSSTPVERKLALAGAVIEDIPLPLRSLRRASTTPADLLTWLAWERSVDRWNEAWPTDAKRKALANSFQIHKIKGTVGALRRVVEPLGFLLEVIEWWQMEPQGIRGTFRLSISVLDDGITDSLYDEINRLIDVTKRLSQHMVGLAIVAETRTTLGFNMACYDGDTMTVYPYEPANITTPIVLSGGLWDHTIDTLTVYPS